MGHELSDPPWFAAVLCGDRHVSQPLYLTKWMGGLSTGMFFSTIYVYLGMRTFGRRMRRSESGNQKLPSVALNVLDKQPTWGTEERNAGEDGGMLHKPLRAIH